MNELDVLQTYIDRQRSVSAAYDDPSTTQEDLAYLKQRRDEAQAELHRTARDVA